MGEYETWEEYENDDLISTESKVGEGPVNRLNYYNNDEKKEDFFTVRKLQPPKKFGENSIGYSQSHDYNPPNPTAVLIVGILVISIWIYGTYKCIQIIKSFIKGITTFLFGENKCKNSPS